MLSSSPPTKRYYDPSQQPKKRTPWLTCLIILLVVMVLCCVCLVVSGVGGTLLVQSGTLTQRSVLALAGLGPGEVTILNLGDEAFTIDFNTLESEESAMSPSQSRLSLDPMEKDGAVMGPGRFRLDFLSRTTKPASCSLRITSNDLYRFVILPNDILVVLDQKSTKSMSDLKITSSPLCKQ